MIPERMEMNKLSLQLPQLITWKHLSDYGVLNGEHNNPRIKWAQEIRNWYHWSLWADITRQEAGGLKVLKMYRDALIFSSFFFFHQNILFWNSFILLHVTDGHFGFFTYCLRGFHKYKYNAYWSNLSFTCFPLLFPHLYHHSPTNFM